MSKLNLKTVAVRMTVEIAIDIPADDDLDDARIRDLAAIGLREFSTYYNVEPVQVTVLEDRADLAQAFTERRQLFWKLRAEQQFLPRKPSDVLAIVPQP